MTKSASPGSVASLPLTTIHQNVMLEVCVFWFDVFVSLFLSLSQQGESPEDLFKQPVVGRPKFPSHVSLSDASGQGRQRSRRLNDMSHGTIAHDSQ